MLSHAIYLALGVMVMGALLIYVAGIRVDMNEQTMQSQLSIAAESIKEDVFELYLLSKESGFESSEEVIIAKIDLGLTRDIGGKDYTIILTNDTVTLSSSLATVAKQVNIGMNMEGAAKAPAYLELVRSASGDTIRVVAE